MKDTEIITKRAQKNYGEYSVKRQAHHIFQTENLYSDNCHQTQAESGGKIILWRQRTIGMTRMLIGGICILAAWYNWRILQALQTTSQQSIHNTVQISQTPLPFLTAWFNLWQQSGGAHPTFSILLIVLLETIIGFGIVGGVLTNLSCTLGILLAATGCISMGTGHAGAADLGITLVAILAFLGLILSNAGQIWGMDSIIAKHLNRWHILASKAPRTPLAYQSTVISQAGRQKYYPIEMQSTTEEKTREKKRAEQVLFM